MTEQEIIEGNKLIAEFMGDYRAKYKVSNDYTLANAMLKTLKYHSSWDWLMPVFKKIWESIDQFQYDDEPYLYITEEIFHPDYLLSDFINNNIEGVWNRCVEFIIY